MWMKIWGFLMASLMGIFFSVSAFPAATFVPETDEEDPNELPPFVIVSKKTGRHLVDAKIVNWDPYRAKWIVEEWRPLDGHPHTVTYYPADIKIYNVDGAYIFIKGNKPYAKLHQTYINKPDKVRTVQITSVIPGIIRIDDGVIMTLMDKNGFEY